MKIFKLLNSLSLALLMGIFCCQASLAQTGDIEKLDDLSVEQGRIQFLFASIGNCYISEGGSINGVTYITGESWWQTRVDAGSPWTEVPDTRRNGICSLDPSEPGEYRIIAEITIDGVAGVYTSSNTFTISSSGEPDPGQDPEPELSYRDQVQIMYVAYYGRPGDAGGLNFWAGKLEEVNGRLKEIIDSFGTSMEFTERFGDLDDEDLVDNIFLQLLGKNADSGGLNFYVNGIREGRFTLASIALNVADGTNEKPEGQDNTVKTNKLRVANAFSKAYVEADAPYGEFQIDDAKLWLAEVDSTEASVTAALDRLPDLLEMFSGGTPPPSGNQPDLAIGLPTVSDGSPDTGASFTLSATVRNDGSGRSAATTLRYYRSPDATISTSDTEVGTDAVSALSASGASSESISLTAPSSAGTYYYGACVDSVSGESSTANNCSGGVRVEVAGAVAGRAGECSVGATYRPGESCEVYGTGGSSEHTTFEVLSDGRGRFAFFTSGGSISNLGGSINGVRYHFAASHQGSGVWRVDDYRP